MVKRRSQLLISDEVQTSLLMRLTLHWFAFLTLNTLCLAAWVLFIESPASGSEEHLAAILRVVVPFFACSLLIVPVFMYDIVRLSNQFVGPIRRVRMGLQKLAETGHFEPIRLRKNDFWHSLATDLNAAMDRTSSAMPALPTAGPAVATSQLQSNPSWVQAVPVTAASDFADRVVPFVSASAR